MDLFASRAYGLFVSELAGQISKARSSLLGAEFPKKSELPGIALMFHTLKGGAGFFGFDDIAELASDLEAIVSAENFLASWDRAVIGAKIDKIAELAANLPKPTA